MAATAFLINLIEAKSDLPLNLFTYPATRSFSLPNWRAIWRPPSTPEPNAFVAFDLTTANNSVINLRLTCTFGSAFVGKDLFVQGLVDNAIAVYSPVKVTGTTPIYVHDFRLYNPRPCPVGYFLFEWRLVEGNTVLGTFSSPTRLELYAVWRPPPFLWGPFGISVNLLRSYVAPWDANVMGWGLAQFYNFTTQRIFAGPFQYENVIGAPRFTQRFGGTYWLDRYFVELAANSPSRINCYDMAGMVQMVLSIFPNYALVRWFHLNTFGYINTTPIKGYGPCNNPFFGSNLNNNSLIAPVNPVPGAQPRSFFVTHAFIVAPGPVGACILDCTCGPHTGTESIGIYMANTVDHVTDYYYSNPHIGPWNVNPAQNGVTSTATGAFAPILTILPPTSTTLLGEVPPHVSVTPSTPASGGLSKAETRSSLAGEVESSVGADEHAKPGVVSSTRIDPPNVGNTTPLDPVGDAMKRAVVQGADPPRLIKVDPDALKSSLEKSLSLKLTFEMANLDTSVSRVFWRFGSQPKAVEVNLTIANSHETALATFRGMLESISAPLNIVLVQKLPLGQASLEGLGGRGYVLSVRGNLFIHLEGLDNSDNLGKIATSVDAFLKQREGDSKSVPVPVIGTPRPSQVKAKVGDTFKVSVEVPDVGYVTVLSDASIAQLIEVDKKQNTFSFRACRTGKVDVQLAFAHAQTLLVATTTVHVEIE